MKHLGEFALGLFKLGLFVAIFVGSFLTPALGQSVSQGLTYYTTAFAPNSGAASGQMCSGCHISAPDLAATSPNFASSGHLLASNNYNQILTAMSGVGAMAGYFNPVRSQSEAFSLSLFIGQYFAPQFKPATVSPNLKVRAGSSSVITDLYPLLLDDGNGGAARDGAASSPGVNNAVGLAYTSTSFGSVSAAQVGTGTSIQYNVSYTANGGVTGSDPFSVRVQNPKGTATLNFGVTVYGITSATSAITGYQGKTYGRAATGGTPLYRITSNDPSADTFTATTLPAGLSVDPITGEIYGTPTTPTAAITLTVGATTHSADSNNGTVTKTLQLTIAGITSAPTVNYPATVLISPGSEYQITAAADGVTSLPSPLTSYSLTGATLQTGLSFSTSTGKISGTPTELATRSFTMSAEISAGVFVSRSLQIAVSAGPVPGVSTNIAVSPTVTTVGTVGNSVLATSVQIIATNTPTSYSAIVTKINGVALGATQTLTAATGLTLSGAGVISGTPTASGDFAVTLSASNVNGASTVNPDVILRINSNLDPAFTSGATAAHVSVGAGGPVTVYSSVVTNGPITLFDVVAPGVLPAGLTINSTTGLVSASAPTTSGTFKATLRATNSGGRTGVQEVTFVIDPTVAPVITSPTFATLAAGVPMTSIQVVATNLPILEYQIQAGSALPTGLSLDGVTGIISGTPSSPGPVTVNIRARNAAGFGTALAVPFTVGVPAPSACTMTVPLNTATSLDLKPCMFPAFVPSGVSILATPSHGAAVVSGTTVTYTPVKNYFGNDTFTAVATFAGGGTTMAGTVTVTITGRPDPTKDTIVTDTLQSQNAAVLLFSNAQLANFSQRMDSLHSPGVGGAGAPRLQYKSAPESNSRVLGANNSATDRGALEPTRMPVVNPLDPQPVPQAISKGQGLDAVATGIGLKALPFAESVASLLTTGTVNLASLVGSNGLPDANGSTSYWVEGIISFGNRDASGGISGYEFSSSGISIGMDRRINDTWAVGFGLGYGRDKTIIGTDGSQNDGRGLSLAGYASYQPSPGYFIDGMLGVGSIGFDSRRYVAPINDFAYSNRKGAQIFGSLAGSYEWRKGTVSVSPYGRINYSTSKLLESTENGAGAYALTYFEQTIESLQGVIGARAESIHATPFGWAVPRVRVEFRHEFRGDSNALISYADQIGGPQYSIPGTSSGRDSVALGIGSDFIMRDGWKLGIDYQLTQASAQESSYSLRLRLTKDFDAKGLPKLIGDEVDALSKPIDVQVDAGYVYDDNVTRAKAGADQRSDSSYSVNVSKSGVFDLTEQSRFILTGSLGGERFQNFNGLSHLSASVEGEFQYRESSEFDAPTFGLFGRLTAEQYQSDLRDGYRYSLGVSVRQPLTDRINLFGALSHNERRGNSAVFNNSDDSIRINADYALSDHETLYASGEFRRGDIVSTGRASLENVSIAKVFVQDDAYPGGQFFSYKFTGSTLLTTLGYNLGLGSRDSLDFSWRRVESTPSLRPSFVTSPKSYIDNQWSITYLLRF